MKKSKLKYKKIFFSLMSLFIVVVGVFYIIGQIGKPPEKWVGLHAGYVSATTQHRALVISDDIVYKSLNNGQISNAETEGKRVKKGQIVGTLLASESPLANTTEESTESQEPEKDDKTIDKEAVKESVSELYENLNSALKSSDNFAAKQLKKELNYKLDYLRKLENNLDDSSDNFNSFEKFIGSVNAEPKQEFNIIAAESGIVSYFIDSLHGKLSYENRYNIDYESIFANPPTPVNVLGKDLLKNQVGLKIIFNLKWHLMCECSLDDLDTFKVDDVLKLQVGSNSFDGTVVDKFMAKNTGIVAFEINEASDYMANSRLLNVTIVKDKMSGVVVPKNAIFTVDTEKGVYVKGVSGEKIFRPVEIIGENEEGLIVSEGSYTYTDDTGTIITVDTVNSNDSILLDD